MHKFASIPTVRDMYGNYREKPYLSLEPSTNLNDVWLESSEEQYWWYDGIRICPVGAYSDPSNQHRYLDHEGERIPAHYLKMSYVACINESEHLEYVIKRMEDVKDPYVLSRAAWLKKRIAQFTAVAMLEDVALPTNLPPF